MPAPTPQDADPQDAEIRAAVAEIVRTELRRDAPLPAGDLGAHLDSVERLTLIVGIEDHFEICFQPEDEADVTTLDDVVALIRARLADRADAVVA